MVFRDAPTVSVLSALPHSLADLEAARGRVEKDYARSSLGAFSEADADIWAQMSTSLGEAAHEFFALCEERAVPVSLNAGRSALAEAARTSDVVMAFAHWKGPHVSLVPPDLVAPVAGLVPCVERCVDRGILAADTVQAVLDAPSEEKGRDVLAESLNDAVDDWASWLRFDDLLDGADDALVSGPYGRGYARESIDKHFDPGALLPGSRLELDDGLWRPADVIECFPLGWDGVCDFICCTSEYLADETKCARPDATFRADSRLLRPERVFPAAREIIERLTRGQGPHGPPDERYMAIAYDCDRKYGG